jgi:hypothetical protein
MYKVARRNRCDNVVAFRRLSESPGDTATLAPDRLERWVDSLQTLRVVVVEGAAD